MPDGWQSVHLDAIDPIAVVDGKLLFSKHQEHRFHEEGEVLAQLGPA